MITSGGEYGAVDVAVDDADENDEADDSDEASRPCFFLRVQKLISAFDKEHVSSICDRTVSGTLKKMRPTMLIFSYGTRVFAPKAILLSQSRMASGSKLQVQIFRGMKFEMIFRITLTELMHSRRGSSQQLLTPLT